MKITVTGKLKEYSDGLTVKQLIEAEEVENPLYVTVTLNDEFVNSEDFDKRQAFRLSLVWEQATSLTRRALR